MTRKLYLILGILLLSIGSISAQRTALVDIEYILSKTTAYTRANQQIEEQSKKWQAEVSQLEQDAASLYKKYQTEATQLNSSAKQDRENAIIAKEKAAYELKKKYFSPEGALVKLREQLIKPLQDKVWNSIKNLAVSNGISLVLDKSSGKIIYADPSIDISGAVTQQLGLE